MSSIPLLHGHRGSRGTHPENTLAGFDEAVDAGADVIEMDIVLSKDGIPMVFHDWRISSKLCRLFPEAAEASLEPVPARQLLAEEFAAFDCGQTFQVAFPEQRRAPAPIPSLEDVLQWWQKGERRVGFNLDLKMPLASTHLNPEPQVFVEAVHSLLDRYGAVEQSLAQSEDYRVVEKAMAFSQRWKTAFQIYEDTHFPETAIEFGWKAVTIDQKLANGPRIQKCREHGIEVTVFTANTPSQWEALVNAGVTGITTDYPRQLRSFLNRTYH